MVSASSGPGCFLDLIHGAAAFTPGLSGLSVSKMPAKKTALFLFFSEIYDIVIY
jgi:hypothetical protein